MQDASMTAAVPPWSRTILMSRFCDVSAQLRQLQQGSKLQIVAAGCSQHYSTPPSWSLRARHLTCKSQHRLHCWRGIPQ